MANVQMPTITLNGKPHKVGSSMTLIDLLTSLEIDRRMIAVAHNGDVVPRDRYDGVCLQDGDSVEVVRMVGGG
jgi:thiamine biosynthesis protein ThiS